MLLVDAVGTRLEAKVPALVRRTRGILDFSELMRRKALPQYTPAAFVVGNGLNGGSADFSAEATLQQAEEIVSVVLVWRSAGDVDGSKSQPGLNQLVWATIYALVGWAPDQEPGDEPDEEEDGSDPIGVLILRRGRLLSLDAGTAFYQLDFALQQQIRVIAA